MIWDETASRDTAPIPTGYEIIALSAAGADAHRSVVGLDGPLPDAAWREFVALLLPGGMFVARVSESGEAVGTASAIHNPAGSRFYFPLGGAIAFLVVDERHRGRGLGRALVSAAVDRLRSAGYRNIWLGVEEHRLPAIKAYLGAGFIPFLHPPAPDVLEERWREVFEKLGRTPAVWPRTLPDRTTHSPDNQRLP